MLTCCYKSRKNGFLDRIVVIDNKLLKIYKDFELENLEAILDFDLLDCHVQPLSNLQF